MACKTRKKRFNVYNKLIKPSHVRSLLRNTNLDDLQHLHASDLSISIQIIHVEGPVEFLLEAAPGGDGQSADELPEVDGPIAILVKSPKRMLGKLGGITIGEKLEKNKKQDAKNDIYLLLYNVEYTFLDYLNSIIEH